MKTTKMQQEIFEQPDVLTKCLDMYNTILPKVVEDIASREIHTVVIAARGTSDHAAIYGKYLIEHKIGLPVSLSAPSILTMYDSRLNFESTLVIGISQSGMAEDVLEVIKKAKEQNALTLSITNNEKSLLAEAADYHLFTNAGLEKSVAATKTFTSQMMMIALLVALWSSDEEMYNSLSEISKGVKKVLSMEDEIKAVADQYKNMESCFVLARGLNYPIALESSLKIQETSYVKAKGYAISDFHHGPFAMVDENTLIIVFAPKGNSYKDAREMIMKLNETGVQVIVVTNDNEFDLMNNHIFYIPESKHDYITPYYNAVWAQLYSYNLSLSKGLNPDSPRGLNKITITR